MAGKIHLKKGVISKWKLCEKAENRRDHCCQNIFRFFTEFVFAGVYNLCIFYFDKTNNQCSDTSNLTSIIRSGITFAAEIFVKRNWFLIQNAILLRYVNGCIQQKARKSNKSSLAGSEKQRKQWLKLSLVVHFFQNFFMQFTQNGVFWFVGYFGKTGNLAMTSYLK